MADNYTPTTDEVREGFAYSSLGDGSEIDPALVVVEQLAAFDRWLATVRREAQADALDEAATAMPRLLTDSNYPAWLRNRAAAIRRTEG